MAGSDVSWSGRPSGAAWCGSAPACMHRISTERKKRQEGRNAPRTALEQEPDDLDVAGTRGSDERGRAMSVYVQAVSLQYRKHARPRGGKRRGPVISRSAGDASASSVRSVSTAFSAAAVQSGDVEDSIFELDGLAWGERAGSESEEGRAGHEQARAMEDERMGATCVWREKKTRPRAGRPRTSQNVERGNGMIVARIYKL
jgi:hypothetical protein